jgi:MinD-like ATPase involved in chromosome partitioning or flagellar assembly
MQQGSADRGKIVTFYSYKGGVGRTMAMANAGAFLAAAGKKVLLVDWDLEAPGEGLNYPTSRPCQPANATSRLS